MTFSAELDRVRELFDAEDYPAAVDALEALLPKLAKTFGEDHEDVLHARVVLAQAYNSVGEPERALELARGVLSDIERHLGADHPLCARAQMVIGRGMDLLDRPEQAEEWYRRAAGEDPVAMVDLGLHRYRAGDREEAAAWWLRAARAGDDSAMGYLGHLYRR